MENCGFQTFPALRTEQMPHSSSSQRLWHNAQPTRRSGTGGRISLTAVYFPPHNPSASPGLTYPELHLEIALS